METNYILKTNGNASIELISSVQNTQLANRIALYIKDTVEFLNGFEHESVVETEKAWEDFLKNAELAEA